MNAADSAPRPPRVSDSPKADALAKTTAEHVRLRDAFEAQAAQHEARGLRISWLRLATFLAAVVFAVSAYRQHSPALAALAALCVLGFAGAVVLHGRQLAAQARARARRDVHVRHLARLGTGWLRFASKGDGWIARDHAYAFDIDLVGQASLFQRIDVTHTRDGDRTLATWLATPADVETARARQAAVRELRDRLEFRQELEASAGVDLKEKLDAARVAELAQLPSLFEAQPFLLWLARGLPLVTLALFLLGTFGLIHESVWILSVLAQAVLIVTTSRPVHRRLSIVSARADALQGYTDMVLLLEGARFESEPLRGLQLRLGSGSLRPSRALARLAFWVNLADLRHNALFHVFLNGLTLWDLNVLRGIERFVKEAGTQVGGWFSVIGELEALSSLAALAHGDPSAVFPELADERASFRAEQIAHPLLTPEQRVANDVHLHGPGSALVVTGSNMAGKSTLLRAVGQNIALALCGGPVIARSMRVPRVRLRASMRADDSLEAGSSYFHAELGKLKRVIAEAELTPPVFFLLDELLRGTNARARHIGAKAVLLHLLARHATGLCATHDVELAALAEQPGLHIENVHFTDVMQGGEMIFDYRLRPGIVRTSNALRLLALAGVDVPPADRDAIESAREAGE